MHESINCTLFAHFLAIFWIQWLEHRVLGEYVISNNIAPSDWYNNLLGLCYYQHQPKRCGIMRQRWENSQIFSNLKINLLWKFLRMCFSTILENLKTLHFSELFQNSHFVLGIPNIWFSGNKTKEFRKTCNTTTRLQLVSLGITVFSKLKISLSPSHRVFSNSSLEKLRRINQNHGIDVKRTIFWCSSCSWLSFRYQYSMHYMYWISGVARTFGAYGQRTLWGPS